MTDTVDTTPIKAAEVTAAELRRYLWILAWSGIVHVTIDNQNGCTIRDTRANP